MDKCEACDSESENCQCDVCYYCGSNIYDCDGQCLPDEENEEIMTDGEWLDGVDYYQR